MIEKEIVNEKIGKFVQRVFPKHLQQLPMQDFLLFLDPKYSNEMLNLNFPLLRLKSDLDEENRKRYYAKFSIRRDEKEYVMTSQWYDTQVDKVVKYLSNFDKENLSNSKQHRDSATISSLSQYLEELNTVWNTEPLQFSFKSLNSNVTRELYLGQTDVKKVSWMFRGHYSESYELKPSAFRENNKENENSIYKESRHFFSDVFAGKSPFEELAIMQHHGIPTRFLDVTANPLVALYFACKNRGKENERQNENGIVYVFPSIELYSDNPYVRELCESIISENDHEDKIGVPLVVRPDLKIDPRVERQSGRFIIPHTKDCAQKIKSATFLQLVVPANAKKKILKELDRVGINEFSLFGDMDHFAIYLKDKANFNE